MRADEGIRVAAALVLGLSVSACTGEMGEPADETSVSTAAVTVPVGLCGHDSDCPLNSCSASSHCDVASATCVYTPKLDGTACTTDSDPKTMDLCETGACIHPVDCVANPTYTADRTQCQTSATPTCNATSRRWVYQNKPRGTACGSDGDDNTADFCDGSTCVHPTSCKAWMVDDPSKWPKPAGADPCAGVICQAIPNPAGGFHYASVFGAYPEGKAAVFPASDAKSNQNTWEPCIGGYRCPAPVNATTGGVPAVYPVAFTKQRACYINAKFWGDSPHEDSLDEGTPVATETTYGYRASLVYGGKTVCDGAHLGCLPVRYVKDCSNDPAALVNEPPGAFCNDLLAYDPTHGINERGARADPGGHSPGTLAVPGPEYQIRVNDKWDEDTLSPSPDPDVAGAGEGEYVGVFTHGDGGTHPGPYDLPLVVLEGFDVDNIFGWHNEGWGGLLLPILYGGPLGMAKSGYDVVYVGQENGKQDVRDYAQGAARAIYAAAKGFPCDSNNVRVPGSTCSGARRYAYRGEACTSNPDTCTGAATCQAGVCQGKVFVFGVSEGGIVARMVLSAWEACFDPAFQTNPARCPSWFPQELKTVDPATIVAGALSGDSPHEGAHGPTDLQRFIRNPEPSCSAPLWLDAIVAATGFFAPLFLTVPVLGFAVVYRHSQSFENEAVGSMLTMTDSLPARQMLMWWCGQNTCAHAADCPGGGACVSGHCSNPIGSCKAAFNGANPIRTRTAPGTAPAVPIYQEISRYGIGFPADAAGGHGYPQRVKLMAIAFGSFADPTTGESHSVTRCRAWNDPIGCAGPAMGLPIAALDDSATTMAWLDISGNVCDDKFIKFRLPLDLGEGSAIASKTRDFAHGMIQRSNTPGGSSLYDIKYPGLSGDGVCNKDEDHLNSVDCPYGPISGGQAFYLKDFHLPIGVVAARFNYLRSWNYQPTAGALGCWGTDVTGPGGALDRVPDDATTATSSAATCKNIVDDRGYGVWDVYYQQKRPLAHDSLVFEFSLMPKTYAYMRSVANEFMKGDGDGYLDNCKDLDDAAFPLEGDDLPYGTKVDGPCFPIIGCIPGTYPASTSANYQSALSQNYTQLASERWGKGKWKACDQCPGVKGVWVKGSEQTNPDNNLDDDCDGVVDECDGADNDYCQEGYWSGTTCSDPNTPWVEKCNIGLGYAASDDNCDGDDDRNGSVAAGEYALAEGCNLADWFPGQPPCVAEVLFPGFTGWRWKSCISGTAVGTLQCKADGSGTECSNSHPYDDTLRELCDSPWDDPNRTDDQYYIAATGMCAIAEQACYSASDETGDFLANGNCRNRTETCAARTDTRFFAGQICSGGGATCTDAGCAALCQGMLIGPACDGDKGSRCDFGQDLKYTSGLATSCTSGTCRCACTSQARPYVVEWDDCTDNYRTCESASRKSGVACTTCGNGRMDEYYGETCESCPQDFAAGATTAQEACCGDGYCSLPFMPGLAGHAAPPYSTQFDTYSEDPATCADDCAVDGDGWCSWAETCATSPLDCAGSELCDGVDNDCDGVVDESGAGPANACGGGCGLPAPLGGACDGPDSDQCLEGTWACNGTNLLRCAGDEEPDEDPLTPAITDDDLEVCGDYQDNDCDGMLDCTDPDCLGNDCRAATDLCDAAEVCPISGTSAACPDDLLKGAYQVCRAPVGPCDAVEVCSGVSAACPNDDKLGPATHCRGQLGVCDKPEYCTLGTNDCPAEGTTGLWGPTTVCRYVANPCDVANEVCDGVNTGCPANVCRGLGYNAGPCDGSDNDPCQEGALSCPGTSTGEACDPGACGDTTGNDTCTVACGTWSTTCTSGGKTGTKTCTPPVMGSCVIPPPSGGGCFVAGTPISMGDGSTRNIEDVVVGDQVLAYDEATGAVVVSVVERTFVHPNEYGTVLVNGAVRVTPEHRFYSSGQWVGAGALNVGDELYDLTASAHMAIVPFTVTSLESLPSVDAVYNFEVRTYHDYFAGGVLVHNAKVTP